jgi:hypothetical protein
VEEPRPGHALTLRNAEHAVLELRHARNLARAMDRGAATCARADQWEIDAEIDLCIAEEALRRLRDDDATG